MSRRETSSHPLPEGNRLFFLWIQHGAALATLLGVVVCPQIGCLIPQDINPTQTTPHEVPHFIVETIPSYLLPPILTLVRQGTQDAALSPPCHCRLEFDQLSVKENPSVALQARWFVDYDTTNPASVQAKLTQEIAPDLSDPTNTTRPLGTYAFDADQVGIVTSGVHIVEVLVGESVGFDPTSTTLPNRAMKPGYTAALYRFAVDVRVEQVVGQCPRTPPSHPVCG